MRTAARNHVGAALLGAALCALLRPPAARAGLAREARSASRATPVERALSGGLVTLRTPGSLMLRVVAGRFVMGSTADEALEASALCAREPLGPDRCDEHTFANETPRRVEPLGSYWLDRSEVTAGDYDRCAARGLCARRALDGARRFAASELPATFVSADEAETYCRARGARLPSEAEFERAARGSAGRRYPWGELYNGKLANHGREGFDNVDWSDGYAELAPVRSFPNGRTPDGFFDLAGNASEWTRDQYSDRYGTPPSPGHSGERVVRGGDFTSSAAFLRGAARRPLAGDERKPNVGFRCARSFEADAPDDAVPAAPPSGAAP
ncbi:MAG TPA: SUMF1/EgtB/PvdO family nonheme iron enzyme [Polyangiaceae bacterium]|nr:SUMF1/EgtB/PvdO family nonheme iron enzyme [Polyangiaceae bacterium]